MKYTFLLLFCISTLTGICFSQVREANTLSPQDLDVKKWVLSGKGDKNHVTIFRVHSVRVKDDTVKHENYHDLVVYEPDKLIEKSVCLIPSNLLRNADSDTDYECKGIGGSTYFGKGNFTRISLGKKWVTIGYKEESGTSYTLTYSAEVVPYEEAKTMYDNFPDYKNTGEIATYMTPKIQQAASSNP